MIVGRDTSVLDAAGVTRAAVETIAENTSDGVIAPMLYTAIGVPESFNVLVQELRGLALDFTIYDDKGKQIALTERDQELIDKVGAGFDKENENA